MAEVWLCRDDALGVDRAVKFLLPERAGDDALRARFAAEARMLAALGGVPGVVRVHIAGEDPTTRRPFFVMDAHLLAPDEVRTVCMRRLRLSPAAAEAVIRSTFETHAESESHAGSAEFPFTLQDALGSEALGTARQLPERAVLALAREISAALSFLHGHAPPVVHRDLKPANLLFAADGRLLLADFGVARTLDSARNGLTRTGMQPGTQRYAAPEILRGDPATPAADWYALGVVIFRALTSSFPQWGEAFPTREGLRPFSPLWEPLLRDLLSPDPARRLADHAEFSRRLDALEQSLDRPCGDRRRFVLPVAVFAAIVLLGAGIAAFRRTESAGHPGERSGEEGPPSASGEKSGESEPSPASWQPSPAPAATGDEILDAVREFLPAVDRIVGEHGVLLPDWNLSVSQFEANPAAREYRLLFARRALDTAERLRRKVEAGEQLYDRDFSQGIVTRAEWEAWLARRRAEEGAARKSPSHSPEPGAEEPEP